MDGKKGVKLFKYLAGYYAILQAFHLIFLGRAGLILLQSGRVPFPASPPSGGWHPSVIPFLMGMASADALAAILGIYFSYSLLVKGMLKPLIGIISLTIALSSAVVYLFGTFPTGAWTQNPLSYLVVLGAFSPILPLYYLLVRQTHQATA
jgi:hypothetical protein